MDKSCVPLPNLLSLKQKVLTLLAKFYCIWFCSDNFHCWGLPGMGLCHQQFFKTIFGFGSRWQLLYIYIYVNRCLSKILPHGVLHQKMRRLRNLQFLCSLWQLGCFLNVSFSSFKTPPGLHSVAKCFAASAQHSCLWKNETLKTAETLYESIFSSMRFWEQEHTFQVGCLCRRVA